MADEIRRQKREQLIAKATRIIETDRKRRIENVKRICESARAIIGPYSPERRIAQLRDLFGHNKRHEAVIDK